MGSRVDAAVLCFHPESAARAPREKRSRPVASPAPRLPRWPTRSGGHAAGHWPRSPVAGGASRSPPGCGRSSSPRGGTAESPTPRARCPRQSPPAQTTTGEGGWGVSDRANTHESRSRDVCSRTAASRRPVYRSAARGQRHVTPRWRKTISSDPHARGCRYSWRWRCPHRLEGPLEGEHVAERRLRLHLQRPRRRCGAHAHTPDRRRKRHAKERRTRR